MKLGTTLRTIESSQGCWNETLTGSFLQGAEVCTFVPSLYAMREVMPVMPATRAAGDSLRRDTPTRIYQGNDVRTLCCFLADIARTSWTQPRPFNGHCLHRIPTISSSEQNQQLPPTFSCCHDLCCTPAHPCTGMSCLLPQRSLDLFTIR